MRLDGKVDHVYNVYCGRLACFGEALYSAINTEVPDEIFDPDPSVLDFVDSTHSNVQSLHYAQSICLDEWVNMFSNIPVLPYQPYETPPVSFPFGEGFHPITGMRVISGDEVRVVETFSASSAQGSGTITGFLDLLIPEEADAFRFEYRFANGGDGDWINFRVGESHVLSVAGPDLQGIGWTTAVIDAAEFAGLATTLSVELVSVGSPNADFHMRAWSFVDYPDDDGDGISDVVDNCLDLANPDQRDTDGDGFGNECDADLNTDCIINALDLGLFRARFFSTDPDADFNGDGVVNAIDLGALKTLFFEAPGPSGITSSCDAF